MAKLLLFLLTARLSAAQDAASAPQQPIFQVQPYNTSPLQSFFTDALNSMFSQAGGGNSGGMGGGWDAFFGPPSRTNSRPIPAVFSLPEFAIPMPPALPPLMIPASSSTNTGALLEGSFGGNEDCVFHASSSFPDITRDAFSYQIVPNSRTIQTEVTITSQSQQGFLSSMSEARSRIMTTIPAACEPHVRAVLWSDKDKTLSLFLTRTPEAPVVPAVLPVEQTPDPAVPNTVWAAEPEAPEAPEPEVANVAELPELLQQEPLLPEPPLPEQPLPEQPLPEQQQPELQLPETTTDPWLGAATEGGLEENDGAEEAPVEYAHVVVSL